MQDHEAPEVVVVQRVQATPGVPLHAHESSREQRLAARSCPPVPGVQFGVPQGCTKVAGSCAFGQ
eukprot:14788690-Alexandrium_andersonii.AAC.1